MDKALEISPERTSIYRRLGDIAIKQGRNDEAQRCYALSDK